MKHEFKTEDVGSWQDGKRIRHGRILELKKTCARIELFGNEFLPEECTVPLDLLTYEEPVPLSRDDLRRFARFEIRYSELMGGRTWADADVREPYQIGPGDLLAALLNFRGSGVCDDVFSEEYFFPIGDDLYDAVGMDEAIDGPEGTAEMPVPNKYSVFSDAWDDLFERFYWRTDQADLSSVIADLRAWEENGDRLLPEREYTRRQKKQFLDYWNDDRLKTADGEVLDAYRKFLEELCAEDDPEALKAKAYACYGDGNAAYGQNWPESMKCLLRLMEVKPDPLFANTLGYMYYYGRCNGGVPEYDKAFYYFSIGAARGYYESRYKLSDMFRHGYGVPRDPGIAAGLIWELYHDQLKKIRKGRFDSNFADVALRAGNLCKDGIDCEADPEEAFYYYLQARYAIRMRILTDEGYGDRSDAEGI